MTSRQGDTAAAANQAASQAPLTQPEQTPRPSSLAEQAEPKLAPPVSVTIPGGTVVRVRLANSLSTKHSRAGDRFTGTLESPIQIGGMSAVPRGTVFNGHVTAARPSGRLKGRASLGVTLDSFELDGKTYPIATSSVSRVSAAHRKRNLGLIGGGSGVGAVLGAIAGGGSGALIGAGAGAAAGTAGAAITGRRNLSLPVETVLSFRLRDEVRL